MKQRTEDGNLALIQKTGSTARIFNLAEVLTKNAKNEKYINKPIFRNKKLNRSIILKCTARGSDPDLFLDKRKVATKVIHPFAVDDLSMGGASVFIAEKRFENMLQALVGTYDSRDDLNADLFVLNALDRLPSMEPYLMRETLKRLGRKPARCYFDLTPADAARMIPTVSEQISGLVDLAFPGGAKNGHALSLQLAHKLLTDEGSADLEPLRLILNLDPKESSEGIFAWKGILYYKWLFDDLTKRLGRILKPMRDFQFVRVTGDPAVSLSNRRTAIVAAQSQNAASIAAALTTHDRAFAELTGQGKPAAFREYLLNSGPMFLEAGTKLGALNKFCFAWPYETSDGAPALIDGSIAALLFENLEATQRSLTDMEQPATAPSP